MRAPAWQRAVMSAVFGYELVALWSRWPTITAIVHRRPWVGKAIRGYLVVHFRPGSRI